MAVGKADKSEKVNRLIQKIPCDVAAIIDPGRARLTDAGIVESGYHFKSDRRVG